VSDEVRNEGDDETRSSGAPSAEADTTTAETDPTGAEGDETREVDAASGEPGAPGAAASEAGAPSAAAGASGAAASETSVEAGAPGAVAGTPAGPERSRRLVVSLGAASVVLALLAAVLGAGWARTSGELAERQRAHAAAVAEQNRLRAELDAVVARRGQLERDLAAAQAQALGPESRAAIEKCVREYAEYERLLREIVASGATGPPGSVRWVTVTPGGGTGSISVSNSCTDAATHLGT
jgi:hypothetical protein